MKHIKLFEEFVFDSIENEITGKLIQFLHEGVKMVSIGRIDEGLVDKAQFEIDLLMKNAEGTPVVKEFVPEIMALVKKFADSGQSGGSAPYTAQIITQVLKKLLMHEPLGDGLTCEEEEWADISNFEGVKEGTGSFQNKRLSSVFKEGKDGRPYYLDAVVFKPVGKDYTFTSNCVKMSENSNESIGSAMYIKSLPFQPKTFVVDVVEKEYRKNEDGSMVEEEGGGWWKSWLKDPKQLDEVYEYYDKKERKK